MRAQPTSNREVRIRVDVSAYRVWFLAREESGRGGEGPWLDVQRAVRERGCLPREDVRRRERKEIRDEEEGRWRREPSEGGYRLHLESQCCAGVSRKKGRSRVAWM